MTVKLNYKVLSLLYKRNYFVNFKDISLSLKKLVPFLLNIARSQGKVVFVATEALYAKTIYNNRDKHSSLIKKLIERAPGVFSNFSRTSYSLFTKFDFKRNPDIIVFFNYLENNRLLIESKKKSIPSISLCNSNVNSQLIDYPIIINSTHYYTIFFFIKLLVKLLSLKKY